MISYTRWTVIALLILLMQVVVLNKIHLWGYATPMLIVYLLIKFPVLTPRWVLLLTSFLLGMLLDTFGDSPGLHASTLLLVGALRPFCIRLYLSTFEDMGNFQPSIRQPGAWAFLKFAATMVLLYHLLLFGMEYFTTLYWQSMLLQSLASSLLTLTLIFILELFNFDRPTTGRQ